MHQELLEKDGADRTIEVLKKHLMGKVDGFEIFFSHEKGLSIEAKEGTVEAMKARSNAGVGLRTISKGRQGFGFSSVLTEDALRELADKTITGGSESAEDLYLRFPAPQKTDVKEEELGLFDKSFFTVREEDKIGTALKVETSALSFDNRVKRVRKASYSESVLAARIVNSNGVDMDESATYYSASVTAVAEEGSEAQMGWDIALGHARSSIDPEKVGRGAAENAVRMLSARKIQTVKCPAVIENTVACELLESLAGSFLGDTVIKGKSMLIGKAGKKVASSKLNIWDDGLMKGGWSTGLFDGEGMVKGRTPLLLEGVCQGYLYDSYWAARVGAKSTGNSARSNYKTYPSVGISNLYIEKGEKGLEGLFAEMGTGIFVTEVLGVHTINTVSGDFSLGAAGFWVEGGKAAYPVRGMAISGNLLGLFSKVEACGSDIRFIGSIGAPSLLLSELEASGS